MDKIVHFIKADDRSCKFGQPMAGTPYRVTIDPNSVTCPKCQSKDTLSLSAQGQAFVDHIGQAHAETGFCDCTSSSKGESA